MLDRIKPFQPIELIDSNTQLLTAEQWLDLMNVDELLELSFSARYVTALQLGWVPKPDPTAPLRLQLDRSAPVQQTSLETTAGDLQQPMAGWADISISTLSSVSYWRPWRRSATGSDDRASFSWKAEEMTSSSSSSSSSSAESSNDEHRSKSRGGFQISTTTRRSDSDSVESVSTISVAAAGYRLQEPSSSESEVEPSGYSVFNTRSASNSRKDWSSIHDWASHVPNAASSSQVGLDTKFIRRTESDYKAGFWFARGKNINSNQNSSLPTNLSGQESFRWVGWSGSNTRSLSRRHGADGDLCNGSNFQGPNTTQEEDGI